ncbi:RILP-like protein 1 isoform X2 [Petromyzon marinus]|uniref:RILP-like protein 1 isoform X2 n=1 Tax=Petromyzon marinus TaxID=7757 RepID=UPI003F7143D0
MEAAAVDDDAAAAAAAPRAWSSPPEGTSPFDKPPLELSAADVWDMATSFGEALKLLVSSRGYETPGDCGASNGGCGGPGDCAQVAAPLAWRVVRALEALEAHVAHARSASREAHALRRELERAAGERERRALRDREHLQYLEQAEELWRQESCDLREKLANSERERARLERALVLSQAPVEDLSDDTWDLEDMIRLQNERDAAERKLKERERELREREQDLKQKEQELRETEREMALSQRETKALQLQVSRLVCMNSELRRQKSCQAPPVAELEARKKSFRDSPVLRSEEEAGLQQKQMRVEAPQKVTAPATQAALKAAQNTDQNPPAEPSQQPKVGTESSANEHGKSNPPQNSGENRESPRYTVHELRHVLEERNQLKAELLSLQEELALYRGEEGEQDVELTNSLPAEKAPAVIQDVSSLLFKTDQQSEPHIKRLIFTAIMPLVAAGLLYDDPTLQPIRNFVCDVSRLTSRTKHRHLVCSLHPPRDNERERFNADSGEDFTS